MREVVRAAPDLGIRYLTLFAFSTENWRRSRGEVAGLMALFRRYLKSEAAELISSGVRVRFIGDRSVLNRGLVRLMDDLEARSRHNDQLHLTVALNYGARDEITRAAVALAREIAAGRIAPGEADAAHMSARMYTAELPDPDLVIRTSGETRVSNFLLWQSAYAEYEFTPTLWPDFTREQLSDIVMNFGSRERRFGAVVT